MYHSITFVSQTGTINTWDDWRLIPTSRPMLPPPEVKTSFVDIPGGDGTIDLTESLAGRPTFKDRSGSFEFVVDVDFMPWMAMYETVLKFLHGRKLKMILEDDPNYYYEGRFSLSSWQTGKSFSTITINGAVSPFKHLVVGTAYQEMEVDGTLAKTLRVDSDMYTPMIVESSVADIEMTLNGKTGKLGKGENILDGVRIQNGLNHLEFKGEGKVTVKDWGGRL